MPNHNQGATFDFKNVHLNFGTHRVSGYFTGSVVTVDYKNDAFSSIVGVDGLGAWQHNADRSATITLVLMPNSLTNTVFSTAHLSDRATNGGLLTPLLLSEFGTNTLYSAIGGRVLKIPAKAWGDSVEGITWVLETTNLVGFIGHREAQFAA